MKILETLIRGKAGVIIFNFENYLIKDYILINTGISFIVIGTDT